VTQDPNLTRPEWDAYFLNIARAVAARGSCRRKRVGAVIVDSEAAIISTGYNGAPRKMPDCLEVGCDVRMIDGRESCVRTIHAESNAIDWARRSLVGATLYTNVIPCRLCALRIIQVGIDRVVYEEEYISQGTLEVPEILHRAGVVLMRGSV
jgi:dCMP deaminase